MKLKLQLFILLFSFSSFLFSQTPEHKTLEIFSVKKLNEDFNIIRNSIEKSHAGLYSYISKKELDEAFDEVEKAIQQPMTSIQFYRKISPLLKLIGNGHTNFFPPSDYAKAINSTLPRFPFAIYWNEGKMFVLRNLSQNENIQVGTIIKSINGEPAEKIFKELANNHTRDAQNTSFPEEKVVRDFSGNYAYFKGTPAFFDLELIDKNGKKQNVKIKGLTHAKLLANVKKRYNFWFNNKHAPAKKPLEFKVENGIGIFTIRSFSKPVLKKSKQRYKKFFKETFAQIKSQNVQHLILDVRNNGGGYPEVIIELYRYLSDVPYVHELNAHTITKKLPHRKHYKYGFWEELELRVAFRLKKEGDIYRVRKGSKKKIYPPEENNFKEEFYVLTNPYSFSATSDLLGMLRDVNRGKFIGGIAGGNPLRCTSWLMPFLVLPNTKIQAVIPLVHMTSSSNFEKYKTGIPPDFFVKNNIDDMINGKDAVMEFTLKMIQKKE